MRSKLKNNIDVRGYVFNHSLEKKISDATSKNPGTEFIRGVLNVATDKEAINVVPVNFSYVAKSYKNGNSNPTYTLLEQIIEKNNVYEVNGDKALKVRITGDIENNDFVTRDGSMASPKRIRGGFVHVETNDIDIVGCAKFEVDMLIESYTEMEPEDGDSYGRLSGFVFNFRNVFVAVDFNIRSQSGMKYFEKADISVKQPMFTKVWGDIVSTTIENRIEIESAFGAPTVKVTPRNLRSWDVIGAATEPYEICEGNDDGGDLNEKEIADGKANRAAQLDEVRRRDEERKNNQDNAFAASTSKVSSQSPTSNIDYKF
jgi:hypothetical protein